MGGESYELGSPGPKTLVKSPCGTLIQSVCGLDRPEQAQTRNQSKAGLIDSSAQLINGLAKTRHTFCPVLLSFDFFFKKGLDLRSDNTSELLLSENLGFKLSPKVK